MAVAFAEGVPVRPHDEDTEVLSPLHTSGLPAGS
jgi:hypothetical protein